MSHAALWPKIGFIFVLALFASIKGETATHTPTEQLSRPTFCSGPEYRQFDFWIGDWDALEAGNVEVVARTRVDRILDGCVLREDYESERLERAEFQSVRCVEKDLASELGNE